MKKKPHVFKLISIFIICAVAIIMGYITGKRINSKYYALDKYAGLTRDDLIEDASIVNISGKTPPQLCAKDVFIVALDKLENSENYIRDSRGTLQTSIGVTQQIHTRSSKNHDSYIQAFATNSSLMKTAGKYMFKKNDTVQVVYGTPTGNCLETVNWSDSCEYYSYDEFSSMLGRHPDYETTYIASSKTVQQQEFCGENGGLYSFKMILNATLSTITYINEVAYISNIDAKSINFTDIIMEFTVDKNFNLVSQRNFETYTLKFAGIPVTINAIYDVTVTY